MKTTLLTTLATLAFTLIGAAQSPADQKESPAKPQYAAVFDFSEGSANLKGQGKSVGTLLNAFLSTKEGLFLVERAELGKIISEQKLSLTGSVSTASAIKVGNITGANILITGRIFEAGKKNYLVAKVISAETSRVYGASVNYALSDELDEAVMKLTDKISKLIAEKKDSLRSKSESFPQMIARLKKGLATPLPKIYVHITETHISQPIPDPACETEMQKILQACGFTIVKNAADADITITGEAFSQRAATQGDFVACRARAEIKISKPNNKAFILKDRITVGAVDLAEEVAAKTALQKAGEKLTQSIILKLK